jgi:hypothetical protein
MNCRTFHRKLEDYLEDGLDFSGRFGMERHAQQCIGCGKVMADAQRLGQMAGELKRVKAPAGFEDSILRKIGNRKLNGRFSRFRRFWIYGFEQPPWRKMALASCSIAVLLLGVFYAFNSSIIDYSSPQAFQPQLYIPQASNPPKPATTSIIAKNSRATNRDNKTGQLKAAIKQAAAPQPMVIHPEEFFADRQEAAYLEYLMPGPDNRPVTVRMPLPKEIQMQYGQTSEEYFIQNVSH